MAGGLMSYIDYRLQLSPSWLLGPNGQTLSTALGTEENTIVQDANYGVLERYPDYAGLDSAGISDALQYIGNDRNLIQVFGDDSNLDATRLYFKSGFSQGAAGITLPWFPETVYTAGTKVGAGGVVWTCTTAGESGLVNPFPSNLLSSQALGQVIEDNDVVWTLSTISGNPLMIASVPSAVAPTDLVVGPPMNGVSAYQTSDNSPGWYWAGTAYGFLDALTQAGFFATDAGGNVYGPRVYRNIDFVNAVSTNANINFVGAINLNPPASLRLVCEILATGTAGVSGRVLINQVGGTPLWTANTVYATGSFVVSAHGYVYWCVVGGKSGATDPFPAVEATYSVWPPTSAQGHTDGTAQWVWSEFSPIPKVVPIGGSWGITFTDTFSSVTDYFVTVTNAQPDGNSAAWARLWVVVPSGQHFGVAFRWGPTPPGEFAGVWGGGPNHSAGPAQWGAGNVLTNSTLYGTIAKLAQNWLPGHVRFIGAWLAPGTDTALDSIPASPWNESFNVDIDGYAPPFFRFNTEL
jgi:hypothetical protein